jgi:RNA polymerase sigma-70 factor (ECF subfamily)
MDGMVIADTDIQLRRVMQGDEEAARVLVEQLYPMVIRIVRSHLPQRAAEEDLAQDVFVKMFAHLGQYTPKQGVPFDHWVARLAVRTCLDGLRAEKRRPELRWSDLSETEAAGLDYLVSEEDTSPSVSSGEARQILEKLLGQLAPTDRLIIHMLDLEQKTLKEINALTGMNITLIKVRAFRARRKLRQLGEQFKKEVSHE